MPFLFILSTQNRTGGNLPPLPKITNNITYKARRFLFPACRI